MAERIIAVNTPEGVYDIVIQPGLLAQLVERAAEFGLAGPVVIATNTTIRPLYAERAAEALANAPVVAMPDGEQYKTLETVAGLYADFVAAGLDRSGTVLALGGGVVGDTAGYAAATYMRGVRLVQMPTTLLSMVDSSVGGKVGVDLPQGKNLVGAFKQPARVLIDTDVLATLPAREWRCGMSEVIKHGLLADEALLDPALWSPERAAELVARAVQVKVDVVEVDPFEQNIRAHLNLGHTFAHAIEQVTHYAIPHGEAVGIGLIAAARLSHALGLCSAALAEDVEGWVEAVGLPVSAGALDSAALYAAMSTDKKWREGRSRFVLLEAIGKPVIVENVAQSEVMRVLDSLRI